MAATFSGGPFLLADSSGAAVAVLVLIVGPAVHAIVCWLLADALHKIPQRYRFIEPDMVWLLLIPVFHLYWNFKVFPAVAESFQAYFYSHGVADVEDCGENLARWICYLALACLIPCVGFAALIAGLVILVLFLIKLDELKKRVVAVQRM